MAYYGAELWIEEEGGRGDWDGARRRRRRKTEQRRRVRASKSTPLSAIDPDRGNEWTRKDGQRQFSADFIPVIRMNNDQRFTIGGTRCKIDRRMYRRFFSTNTLHRIDYSNG